MGCCSDKPAKIIKNPYEAVSTSDKKLSAASYTEQKMVNQLSFICVQGKLAKQLLHRSIVALLFKNPTPDNRYACGSGVLLSCNLVLTAAHNIYDKKQNKQIQKKDYKIFESIGEFPHNLGLELARETKSCNLITPLSKSNLIQKKVIDYKQFLELRPPCSCIHRLDPQLKLQVFGYPRKQNQNYQPQDKQYQSFKLFQYGHTLADSIAEVIPQQFKITYKVNTLQGHSGCPVVVNNQIIAIHTGSAKTQNRWNIGRLITPDLIKNVIKWAKQLKGNLYCVDQKVFCPHLQSKIGTITFSETDNIKINAQKLKEQYKNKLPLDHYKKNRTIYQQIQGENTLQAAAILVYGIGDNLVQQCKYEKALQAYERALAIIESKEKEDTQNKATILHKIGAVYYLLKKYDLAFENCQKTLDILKNINKEGDIQLGRTVNNIGLVYFDKGYDYQALECFKKCLQIYKRAKNGSSIDGAYIRCNIANVYRNKKKIFFALQQYQKALAIFQSIGGNESVDVARTMMNIGIVHDLAKDSTRAVDYYNRSIAIFKKHQLRHREYANTHFNLGIACCRMKDYNKAAASFRICLHIFKKMKLDSQTYKSSLYLAICMRRLGDQGEMKRIISQYELDQSQI